MAKTQILSIVGARPQFVKTAIVSEALARHDTVAHDIVHTGQHFDINMSDVFFSELRIPAPRFNLGIASGGHGAMTGRMLESLEALLLTEKPDAVVVYGDTNSTLAGALAAAKLHIPLAHVEAGLRSFNRMPEEINRVLTDHVSDIHFSVTDDSTANLAREGIRGEHVYQVGDVMLDCAIRSADIAERTSDALQRFDLSSNDFILCTVHRAANTDDPDKLSCLLRGLAVVAETVNVILPLHPRARTRMDALGISIDSPGFKIVEPISYLDMTLLERHAALIVTDSGGVQREAFFHQRPCVTFRDETEWNELVRLGWNVLAPLSDPRQFADCVLSRLGTVGQAETPYGTGDAGRKIAEILMNIPTFEFRR